MLASLVAAAVLGLALGRQHEVADTPCPAAFKVQFNTNIADMDPIVLEVTTSLAPLGAQQFFDLLGDKYYDGAAFFRVVPDFVAQFGIAADPAETAKWNTPIPDDPVVGSNTIKTMTFATAGPNTRTTQLFINYQDNSSLDAQGFAPFATVVSGWDTVLAIFNPTPGSSGGVSQPKYEKLGNPWLLEHYPGVSLIETAVLL